MSEPTKRPAILFAGDPHSDFRTVVEQVLEYRPVALVLLGDLQPQRSLEVELAPALEITEPWFVHGNHDCDSDQDYDHVFNSKLGDRNLHGRVVDVAGFRVAGLGGVFRQKVWDPGQPLDTANFHDPEQMLWSLKRGRESFPDMWRGGIQRKHRCSIFPSDILSLQGRKADILVTHEAPGDHPYGFSILDSLAMQMGVRMVVHGHHHQDLNYEQAGLMAAGRTYEVFSVNKGSCLLYPSARFAAGRA